MRLYLMVCARQRTSGAPAPSYLIQTTDFDQRPINILVDTGFPDSAIGSSGGNWYMTDDDYVVNQLARVGVTPSDISYVVCTHLDPDHAGNHNAFPDAEFVVQRAHYDAATSGKYDRFGKATVRWRQPNLRYRCVDGDTDLATGVRLIETSGHVLGHQSVLLHLPNSGAIILAADAIVHVAQLDSEHRAKGTFDMDDVEAVASTRKLMQLARCESALVIMGHDIPQWATLKKMPQFYD